MKRKEPLRFVLKVINSTVILCIVLAVLYACNSIAEENTKIKLPDGLYMYDSSIETLQNSQKRVGFGKYFVVQHNILYSPQKAIKKFGVSQLNKLFIENRKYKILFGSEQIGEIFNVKVYNEKDWNYEDKMYVQDFKEGPMYGKRAWCSGSSIRCIAVPENFKERKEKNYYSISKEEIEKISKIIKDQLFDLIKNRKELTHYKLTRADIYNQDIEFMDKISWGKDKSLYIGTYWYDFKTKDNSCSIQILFTIENDIIKVITSNYDDDLKSTSVEIYGMLDVDGCGKREIIVGKTIYDEIKLPTVLEIYKQKTNGDWTRLKKINLGE